LSPFCSQPARLRVWAHRWSLTALLCPVLPCPALLCSASDCAVLCCDVLSVHCWPCPKAPSLASAPVPGHPVMQAAAFIPGPKIKSSVPTLRFAGWPDGSTTPAEKSKSSPRAKLHGPKFSTSPCPSLPLRLLLPRPRYLRHSQIQRQPHTTIYMSSFLHVSPSPTLISCPLLQNSGSWALDSQAKSGRIPIRVVAARLESTSPPSTPSS
jgi:hypothetical protein